MHRICAILAAAILFLGGSGAFGAARESVVGKAAPDFSGKQVDGQPLSLARFRGKVPVILTFWSIYCKSCTEEMAALQRLFEKHGPEKLAVIAVNEDGDVGLGRVNNFLSRFPSSEGGAKLSFPIFFDEKGDVYEKYAVASLPTLIYIGKDGKIQERIEGYERGKELAVTAAIENLVGSVSPTALKESAQEETFDLDVSAPICGTYRDGKWYRPLDLDEAGRPEAIARARAQGEEHLRREAVRLALSDLGYSLNGPARLPGCFAAYGMEIRTPRPKKDTLDLLLEKLNLPRMMDVSSQETVEREQELILYRRYKIQMQSLREQMESEGYSPARSTVRVRFVQASRLEERSFVEAVATQYPYLSELRKETAPKGPTEYILVSQAAPDKVIETLRGLDVGPRKLSVELVTGDIAEVAMWR